MKAAVLLIAFLSIISIAKSQPGKPDPDFGTRSGYTLTRFSNGGSGFHGIAIQSDGKIVAAGDEHRGESAVFVLARYQSNGQLDATFGSGGKVLTDFNGGNDRGRSVAIQNNGKIVVAGYTYNGKNFDFGLARYERDGSLDKNFGDGGKVVTALGTRNDLARAMVMQKNGSILMTGEFWKEERGVISSDFVLVRYKSNGKLDENFGTDGTVITDFNGENDKPRTVAVQPDGKIIVAGQSFSNRKAEFSLVRYNSNGSPDNSFGTRGDGTVVTDMGAGDDLALSLALQPDGKILLAGEAHNGSNLDIALARYNTNGSLDTSFGTRSNGKIITDIEGGNDQGRSISLQENGKIIVAGQTTKGNNENAALVRYNSDGSPDSSFGERGDGKVVTDFGGSKESFNASVIVGEKLLVAGHFGANANADNEEALIAAYDLSETIVEDVLLSVVLDKHAAEDDKDGFFEVAISNPLATDLTIRYSLAGTAEKGKDYSTEPEQNELVLKAGKTKEKIKIIPVADDEVEEEETIILTLEKPSAAGVVLEENKNTATMQLTDNDEEVVVEDVVLSVAVTRHATEKDKDGEFEVEISEALPTDLTISYRFSGTALKGNAYITEPEGEQLVLKAGKTKAKIKVKKQKKSVEEQTIILELQAPVVDGLVLDERKKSATMRMQSTVEDLEQAVLSVVLEKDAAEDGKDGFFELLLSEAIDTDLNIGYTLTGTATAGTDYVSPGESVVLKAGKKSIKIKIEVKADTEVEGEETVILTLKAPAAEGVVLDEEKKSATLKIEDNDEEVVVEDVVLSVAKAKDAAEDDKDGEFELRVSKALDQDLNIRYTLSGTATAGTDYVSPGETVVLKAGERRVVVAIEVLADDEVEGEETVTLSLEAPAAAGVVLDEKKKEDTLKIRDNDEEQEVEDVLLSVAVDRDAAEPDLNGSFIISTSEVLDQDITIRFKLSGTAGKNDYSTLAKLEVVIPKGSQNVEVPVQVIDDAEIEGEETVILELLATTQEGVSLDEANKVATLKIKDNDEDEDEIIALISASVGKHAAEDADHGYFLIKSSIALPVDITLSYSLAGTAAAGTDYVSPGRQVVLPAGMKAVRVEIEVVADTEVEEDETVILTLQPLALVGITLDNAKKAATLNIEDDDEYAYLSVAVEKDAAEDAEDGAFIISSSVVRPADLTIVYSLSGTAQKGTDYTTAPEQNQVVLKAGQRSVKVLVKVKEDTEVEEDETVVLALETPTAVNVLLEEDKKTASLKIKDNDEEIIEDVLLSVVVVNDATEDSDEGIFEIAVSKALTTDLTIRYSLSGTATPGVDYETPGGELVLKAGTTTGKIIIVPIADEEVEANETIVLTLESPAVAALVLDESKRAATMQLRDNNTEVEDVLLSVRTDKNAEEDDKNGFFEVAISKALPADLTIRYSLSGTATAGADYDSPGEQLVLKAGQTSGKVMIAVKADSEVEEEETVVLTLIDPSLAGVRLDEEQKVATLSILDNDEEIVDEEPVNSYAVLPNLFSPNGDQMNDIFVLHAENVQAVHWRIFNRNGRLVYETKSVEDAIQLGWDGTVNGEPQPEDSYMWILIYQDNSPAAASTKLTGSVTLIR